LLTDQLTKRSRNRP